MSHDCKMVAKHGRKAESSPISAGQCHLLNTIGHVAVGITQLTLFDLEVHSPPRPLRLLKITRAWNVVAVCDTSLQNV